MAYGNLVPAQFNQYRVPDGQELMAYGQHAADPHKLMDREFMDKFFIVGGALPTIPPAKPTISVRMNLKRCGMCQVFNRVFIMFPQLIVFSPSTSTPGPSGATATTLSAPCAWA